MTAPATDFELDLLPLQEMPVAELLGGVGRYTVCVNEPPWSTIAPHVPVPERVVDAWDMDQAHLETLLEHEPDSDTVVGIGGGSALDTAKFIAWRTGKRLIQVPSITSVDAAFTDAIGVRDTRRVKYIGTKLPELVVLDVALVRRAPARLNRAGIGDILSCHTALFDWQLAARRRRGPTWHPAAAALGRDLLDELTQQVDAIRTVTPDAVRWLANAYRRIGAACGLLGHSRFEEGAEHFLAYACEYITGAHPMHGELIALCAVAVSELQDNAPAAVRNLVERSGVRAHPLDLGISQAHFVESILSAQDYVMQAQLDYSILSVTTIDPQRATQLWHAVASLPHRSA